MILKKYKLNKRVFFEKETSERNMNKRGDISVLLLVLMTIVLTGAALFIFNTNTGSVGTEIINSRFLDKIYFKEDKIDFYVNEAIESSLFGFDRSEKDFVSKFKKEIDNYSETDVWNELEKIKNNFNEENVEISGNEVTVKISVKIDENLEDKLIVSHLYEKSFKKSF